MAAAAHAVEGQALKLHVVSGIETAARVLLDMRQRATQCFAARRWLLHALGVLVIHDAQRQATSDDKQSHRCSAVVIRSAGAGIVSSSDR